MSEHRFESREAASLAAATHISEALQRRLEAQAQASLVVSGGTTPVQCFENLAGTDLSWSDVHIVLSDERWVPADSDDSNENLVRQRLMTRLAADATLLPMFRDDTTAERRSREIETELKRLPFPFAAALLGMGTDGHVASLFPDAKNLDAGLDVEFGPLCMPVRTAASPFERISLTLAALSRSDAIMLLIFGQEKWDVLQAAKSSPAAYPVSHLFTQKRAPVSVYWAA